MNDKKLEDYIDLLMTAALRKCGSLEDARDLTQDTLLAALRFMREGTIENPQSWLLSVMNRKFYDMLRRKYKYPTVTISEVPDDVQALMAEFGEIMANAEFIDLKDPQLH